MPKQRITKPNNMLRKQPLQAKASRSCENLGMHPAGYQQRKNASNSNLRKQSNSKSATRIGIKNIQAKSYFPPLTQSIRSFYGPSGQKIQTQNPDQVESQQAGEVARDFTANVQAIKQVTERQNSKRLRKKSGGGPKSTRSSAGSKYSRGSATYRRTPSATRLKLRQSATQKSLNEDSQMLINSCTRKRCSGLNLAASRQSLDIETVTGKKSRRARCSACRSLDAKKGNLNTCSSSKSMNSNAGKSQPRPEKIGRLRERHAMLKKHIWRTNKNDSNQLFQSQGAGQNARKDQFKNNSAYKDNFLQQTSNFYDQNFTAEFQNSRKTTAVVSSTRSNPSLDRNIVNILTDSQLVSSNLDIKQLNHLPRTKSSSPNASNKNLRFKPGHRSDKSAVTSRLSFENSQSKALLYRSRSRDSAPSSFDKPYHKSTGQRTTEQSMTLHQGSIAQTTSQQYLNNQNMIQGTAVSTLKLDPAQNTIGQTVSARASPSISYFARGGDQHQKSIAAAPFFAQSQAEYDAAKHRRSLGVSDHAASLESTSNSKSSGKILVQHDVIPCFAAHPSAKLQPHHLRIKINNLQQQQHSSMQQLEKIPTQPNSTTNLSPLTSAKQTSQKMPIRPTDTDDYYSLTKSSVEDWTQRSRQQTTVPKATLHFSEKTQALKTLEHTWSNALDELEKMQKNRVSHLRSQLTQIIKQNKMNLDLEGANDQFQKALLDVGSDQREGQTESEVHELLKAGFNMDQERVIRKMQAELVAKTKLESDMQRFKNKYKQSKEKWLKQLRVVETRAQSQRNVQEQDLQNQIRYYRAQAEDMAKQMHLEIQKKQEECDNAISGGQGYRQALLHTKTEASRLQDQTLHLNELLKRSESEIDRYRVQFEQVREQAEIQEANLLHEASKKVKEMKQYQKQKYQYQLDQVEKANQENLRVKIQEARDIADELHRKDLQIAKEKFELRMQQSFIDVEKHESVVKQVSLRERQESRNLIDEAMADKDSQIAQITNDFTDQAQKEQRRLEDVIEMLKEEIKTEQQQHREDIAEKERQWSEIFEARTKQAQLEAEESESRLKELTQQLLDVQQEKTNLKVQIVSLQADLQQNVQKYSTNEGNMMRDIDELSAKLESQFRLSEDLASTQNKARELKDSLKLQRQENSALLSQVKTHQDACQKAVKESLHLKKRINWITQLKQSQIRQLKSDLVHLQTQLSGELKAVQAQFAAQVDPVVRLAGQLSQRVVEKEKQLERMSSKFENVIEQLDKATTIKDAQSLELRECVSERDSLQRELEKMDEKNTNNEQSQKKEKAKIDRERTKIEQELADTKSRSSRLEERVFNLKKLADDMSAQVKEITAQLETARKQQQADLKDHERKMAEKEKKLQEVFCTKLDRKINKLAMEHKKSMDEVVQGHEQQIMMFEQDFQVAQTRIFELERHAISTESRQQQQRQRTKEREAWLKRQRQTEKIEYEVSKSIEKALGHTANRRKDAKLSNHIIRTQQQPDPYLIHQGNDLINNNPPGIVVTDLQVGSQGALPLNHGPYQPMILNRKQHSPYNSKNSNNTLSRATTQQQFLSPSQQLLGISINDLQHQVVGNSTASFVVAQQPQYQNEDVRAYFYNNSMSNSTLNQRKTPLVRSRSSIGQYYHPAAAKTLYNGSLDLERENYPPSHHIVRNKHEGDYSVASQPDRQTSQSHEAYGNAVFNPMLTMKPGTTSQSSAIQVQSSHPVLQQEQQKAVSAVCSEPASAPLDSVSNVNISREVPTSRSFEAKLLSNSNEEPMNSVSSDLKSRKK